MISILDLQLFPRSNSIDVIKYSSNIHKIENVTRYTRIKNKRLRCKNFMFFT